MGGFAAAPTGGVSPQRTGISVIFERHADQTNWGRGKPQRREGTVDLRDRHAWSDTLVGGRRRTLDRLSPRLQAGSVVGAFVTDSLGSRFDPGNDEPGILDLSRTLLAASQVKHARAQMAAEVGVGVEVGLVSHRLGGTKRGEQAELAELRQRRVDGGAAEFGQRLRGLRVDLVGGQMLSPAAMKHAQDCPPLRCASHPPGPEKLAGFVGREGRLASIAAEEFGHIELVSAAINTMLTDATNGKAGKLGDLTGVKDARNLQHFISGGAGSLVQDSNFRPWTGDNVFSSGDLVEDLTHNFFLETGARNNKLKVYEMVDHPAARALTGYLLVRGGVHQVAYARALENLTGANLMKLFPAPRIPTDKIPECKPHIKRGEHLKLYRFSPNDFNELAAVFNGPHPETGEDLFIADEISPEGAPAFDLPSQPAVFAPGPDPEIISEVAAKLRKAAGLPKKPTGVVANGKGTGVAMKVKESVR
jgi:Mn-containing catalase